MEKDKPCIEQGGEECREMYSLLIKREIINQIELADFCFIGKLLPITEISLNVKFSSSDATRGGHRIRVMIPCRSNPDEESL